MPDALAPASPLARISVWLWARVQAEPVATGDLVRALILAATAFGLGFSPTQIAAAVFLSNTLISWLTRRAVTPNAKVGP